MPSGRYMSKISSASRPGKHRTRAVVNLAGPNASRMKSRNRSRHSCLTKFLYVLRVLLRFESGLLRTIQCGRLGRQRPLADRKEVALVRDNDPIPVLNSTLRRFARGRTHDLNLAVS